jgi:hypothetical protein
MEQHTVRFRTENETRLLRVIAAYDGVSVSSWIRDTAIAKMHAELPEFLNDVNEITANVVSQNSVTNA